MSGSLSKLTLNGLPFDVANDADITEVFTKYTNTIVQTSGRSSISQESRVQEISGVVIIIRPGDKGLLKSLSESGREFNMSYAHRDGTVYRAKGTINIESNTTMQNRTTVTLLPTTEWTEFI